MNSQELAKQLQEKYLQLREEAGQTSQSLMSITDLHDDSQGGERDKMLAIGREIGVYRKLRVYKAVAHLLNRHLSHHSGVRLSMEEVLQALENLARRDGETSVIGPVDRFIVTNEGDAPLYQEIYEEIKARYEASLLD